MGLDWYVADKKYVNYLKNIDNRVGNIDYGDNLKLHIGILITINKCNFYVPVSSPKEKHLKMNNTLDFHKISNENELYAVINLNNMIPIPSKYVTKLKYNEIDKFRVFSNEKEKNDYIYLLQNEKRIIDNLSEILKNKAKKLYRKVKFNPNSLLAKRCCDFKLLEEACLKYESYLSTQQVAITLEQTNFDSNQAE